MIFARAALIGCGMIGGSLMAALRAAGAVERVVGFDRDPAHCGRAQAHGLVDEVAADARAAVLGADLVVLAAPVGATAEILETIAPSLQSARLVTDVGSTKLDVLEAAERTLPEAGRFCGAHPMAGTERSGPDAAEATLFAGRVVLLTPSARTSADALAACEAMWAATGARPVRMAAAEHDRAMAWVSHLPHAAAFALAAAVGGEADDLAGLWGGGFADTTRIAASDATMWRDIFLANRAPLLDAIDGLSRELSELRGAIEAGDAAAIERLIERARAGRRRVMAKR
jgi:prephenate dehydrogenase